MPDKALIEAAHGIAECQAAFERPDAGAHLDVETVERLGSLWDTVTHTPPQSLAGIEAKLRLLCDEYMGFPARLNDDDIVSLRQVLATVEKMNAAAR